ncbi:hypothetical protein HY68_36715 [Streptomyces sp. AcH 505]|nr:hypothetical protein HY68_36715 [Streptomyces sp. AcH 505]
MHPVPLNLAVFDHIVRSVDEVTRKARAQQTRNAGPVPADVAAVYDWWRASTPDLEGERRLERERVIYRQGLEHAIAAGDHKVIRPHPCPGCGTWGLFWDAARRRAVCAYQPAVDPCVDSDGIANTWSLGHLAYEHVNRLSHQEKAAGGTT